MRKQDVQLSIKGRIVAAGSRSTIKSFTVFRLFQDQEVESEVVLVILVSFLLNHGHLVDMKALEGNLDCIQKYIVTEISLSIDALMYFKYETVTTFLKKGMAQSSHPFLVSVA